MIVSVSFVRSLMAISEFPVVLILAKSGVSVVISLFWLKRFSTSAFMLLFM